MIQYYWLNTGSDNPETLLIPGNMPNIDTVTLPREEALFTFTTSKKLYTDGLQFIERRDRYSFS